jgi:hypothetical protein
MGAANLKRLISVERISTSAPISEAFAAARMKPSLPWWLSVIKSTYE